MLIAICAVGVLLLVLLYDNTVSVKASDGIRYNVVSGGDVKRSADVLAFINEYLVDVMRYLRDKYIYRGDGEAAFSYPTTDTPRQFVERLLKYYNPEVIREHIPEDTANTSYVVNKGASVVFCLRNDKVYEDKSTIKFVAMHELTHIGTLTYGHGNDFWENFKFVLKEAQEGGLYTPINYAMYPVSYCGLRLDYNPLFD